MLANPIVIPAYAHPIAWLVALLSIGMEVEVARGLLSRFGLSDPRFARPLVVINLCTWVLFLAALDRLDVHADAGSALWLIGLEFLVVIAEAALIFAATRGHFFSSRMKRLPLRAWQVAYVSLLANLVSAAMSLVLVLSNL